MKRHDRRSHRRAFMRGVRAGRAWKVREATELTQWLNRELTQFRADVVSQASAALRSGLQQGAEGDQPRVFH